MEEFFKNFFPNMWIYLYWPDVDHTLLLEHFNVIYKHAKIKHCFPDLQFTLFKQLQKLIN